MAKTAKRAQCRFTHRIRIFEPDFKFSKFADFAVPEGSVTSRERTKRSHDQAQTKNEQLRNRRFKRGVRLWSVLEVEMKSGNQTKWI